jgi:sigma-E factor negative regulatory protein RseA
MNHKTTDLTSALLDGELDPETEQRAITALLDSGPDEVARFARYHLIGDVIRGESSVLATSVAGKVQQALVDEPVILTPRPRRSPQWLRPVAGLAVAASVASAAILVAPQLMTTPDAGPESVQVAAQQPRTAAAPVLVAARQTPVSSETARWHALDKDLEARLNRLVIEHQEFGGRTGINGPVPHIGLVSYGTR